MSDLSSLVALFESYLEDYNAASTSPMRLVMFLDAIEHVSRLCRYGGAEALRATCSRLKLQHAVFTSSRPRTQGHPPATGERAASGRRRQRTQEPGAAGGVH